MDYPGEFISQPPKGAAPMGLPDASSTSAAGHELPLPGATSSSMPAVKPPARRKHYTIGSGKQITRTRVSYSCHTCRRRKVKCDKVHPICGNCQKNGSDCVYDSRSLQPLRPPRDRLKRRRDGPKPTETCLADILSPYAELQGSGEQKPGSNEIAARLDRLTSMIERLSRSNGSPNPRENDPLLQGVRALYEATEQSADAQDTGNLTPSVSSRSASRQSSHRPPSDSESNEDFPIPSGLLTDLVDPVGTLNLGHLSLEDQGKSRYVGTTYWAYISDEINELNQLLRGQNQTQEQPVLSSKSPCDASDVQTPPSFPRSAADVKSKPFSPVEDGHGVAPFTSDDFPLSFNRPIEPDMLKHVPTKEQSNILYKGFMSGIHAVSPVVHPPTVLRLYGSFWSWYEHAGTDKQTLPEPSFLPLLYAIWYGGSVTISLRTIHAEFNVDSRSDLSKLFHDEVTRWLKQISFPRSPTLYGLSAFLLVQTILSKEEEPLTSSLFISLALRVAQTMGLHRDPAQFGVSPCEAENRRRVWWHIVHMDGVVAMSSGLPPLVSDENYWDVRITSDVKDTLIGTSEADEYERAVSENRRKPDQPSDPSICGNSMVNVYYIYAKGKYVMALAIRKILRIQLGTKPVTRQDMEDLRSTLMDLQSKLHSLVDRIPIPKGDHRNGAFRYLSFKADPVTGGPGCHEQYHTPILAAFHKWARIILSLFVDKAFCVAYQPFLKNAKSKIWPAARQCALRHCHGFMEKFISIATDPEFQPFQWSWPGNHQPMHATMIMLIDLYERPDSPEAPMSRVFIDKIFSLSGPDGGVVGGEDGISTARPLKDGGREAWDMMRRLREKAWLKVGLNPMLFWTQKAQYQTDIPTEFTQNRTFSTSPQTLPPGSRENSSCANFVDSYYSLITAANENNQQVRSPEGKDKLREPLQTEVAQTCQMSPHTPASWTTAVPNQNLTQRALSDSGMWPLQPQVPGINNVNDTYGLAQMPPRNPGHLRRFLDSSSGYGHPHRHSFNSADPPIITKSQSQQQPPLLPQQQPTPNQAIAPFESTHPMANQHPDPNVNFDWDQWDAVFGQYLPVVDGFMELDGAVEGNKNCPRPTGDIPVTRLPVMSGEYGMKENTHTGGEMRNWADFG